MVARLALAAAALELEQTAPSADGARVKLLFILDPLDALKAYKDTSVAMMRAAQARGHQVFACEQARPVLARAASTRAPAACR